MTGCGCESSFCAHGPGGCRRDVAGGARAQYVGAICARCAERMRETGGAGYLLDSPAIDRDGTVREDA